MDYFKKIITDLELNSVTGIRECFEFGIRPNQIYNGKTLFEELIGGYLRSENFKDCVKVFVEYGLDFENQELLAVLLDDSKTLEQIITEKPNIISERLTLHRAFTPLEDVTLLHICAEFNHLSCAMVLVDKEADVNAKAGIDEFGFDGQTPIFHIVNQNNNYTKPMLDFLLSKSANLDITAQGIIWGKGYDRETLIPAVNPIS